MKVKSLGIFILVILLTLCGLPVLNCRWEAVAESAPEPKGGDDLRAKAQNPVSSMYSLPLKLTADFGAGNGDAYFFNINPVIPVTVGDWNLISRALIPALVSVDGKIQGTPPIPEGESSDDRKTGLGDINYSLFVSPADAKGFIWGLGPSLTFPTATDDLLGSEQWSAGPGVVVVKMTGPWVLGGVANNIWSFAGDDDRSDVNLTNLQYFVYYSLDETTSIGASPNIIANWEQDSDNVWTVPVGLGISRTFQFGKLPVRFGAEAHYSIVQPDDTVGQEWNFRFYVIPAVPSALFKWLD